MRIIEVVENINRGGFGIIDKVVCDDGNVYARKKFSPSDMFISDKELCDKLKARFVREVRTQKFLNSDFFIPVLFDNLNAEEPFFIMPVADDVYSNEIIKCKEESRLPEGLGDILNALEFLHDKGLVHRDIKPQNILKHNGIWKLADFGLISHDKEILSVSITTSKNAYGTLMYCSPEQIMEFNRITPQADIYSFGAILHDIFTDGSRVPHSELTAEGEIGHIIEKCTKFKKEQRFKNVKLIRTTLLTFLSRSKFEPNNESDKEVLLKFEGCLKWDDESLEEFIFYIKRNPQVKDNVFENINEEILEKFYSLNKDLTNDLFLIYLDWVYNRGFDFNFCDVIINIIHHIYNSSKDIEVKSKCVISAAELGRSHNRWYVMTFVTNMAGKSISESLAFRISMEIELDERNKNNLVRCATQNGKLISVYHPSIYEILNKD